MDKKTNDAVLTCGIARDLLPLYLDGLTSPESAAALEAHLASCPDCRAVRAALETPLPGAEESPAARSVGDGAGTDGAPPQTEVAEKVLKRAARRGWRRALIAALTLALLIVGGIRFWDWGMGTPVPQKAIQVHAVCPVRNEAGEITTLMLFYTVDEAYKSPTYGSVNDGKLAEVKMTYKPFAFLWWDDNVPVTSTWAANSYLLTLPAEEVTLNGETIWTLAEHEDDPTPDYANVLADPELMDPEGELWFNVGAESITLCSGTEFKTWSYDGALLDSGAPEELGDLPLYPIDKTITTEFLYSSLKLPLP